MSYFEPDLQPVIVKNLSPDVTAIIEPPQGRIRDYLRAQGLYILPRTVVLKPGEWHLFLNGYFNEPYGEPKNKAFNLHRNFDVDQFLKSKGLANLQTLQGMMVRASLETRGH